VKKLLVLLVLALAVVLSAAAQQKGPLPDKVYIDARTQEDIGMKDTAEGKTDVFFWGVNGPQYKALPRDVRDKLDLYVIPSGSWSFVLNPCPDKAPYTATTKEGKTVFNPFAIREVRFALNFLMNRKYIVDEILGGDGTPAFTGMTEGQPGTYRYNLLAVKYGFTPEGNEKKAVADITAAMEKAAALPENRGKLAKRGQWWMYNGEPVTVKFAIRVDDPTGRLREGRYFADQVEKTGIKVDRLEWDRKKCVDVVYDGDPAEFEWHLYTEGWGAGATRAYWDVVIAQMYSPYFGNMPGWQSPDYWNYTQAEIDRLSQKTYNGNFLTEDEYWRDNLRATDLGLQEAVRLYVANQLQYYVANKDRFNKRMVYGLGDGLNNWSVITADVKPEAKTKERILRLSQFSARGALFMFPWDPVGPDGCSDTYTLVIVQPTCDMITFEAPNSAIDTPLRADWSNVQTKVHLAKDAEGNDKLIGEIPVPANALMYNSASKKWESVGSGKTAYSSATYSYKLGKWHNGQPMRMSDLLYATAFTYEWMNKDGDNDKYYDAAYDSAARPRMEPNKGWVLNRDGTLTSYYDYNWMTKERVAATGPMSFNVTASGGVSVCVSWDILEALGKLVAEGGKSGTVWGFTSDEPYTEVDLINPTCVADIKAKLQEMKASSSVPACIKDYISARDAVAMYDASIKFIDQHGHAWISNGPFYIERIDTQASFVELRAVRDPSYPYTPDYWPKYFVTKRTRIDGVTLPSIASRDREAMVSIKISEVEYPADTAAASSAANVKVTLIADSQEKVYTARRVAAGEYQAVIPAADMKALKAGSYTLVVESVLAKEAPAVQATTLVVF
jgi:peptide/nickel transport system substrate-binding protein